MGNNLPKLLICFIFLVLGCVEVKESNLKIDNSDVQWDGSYLGLRPLLSERAKALSLKLSATEQAWLFANLNDQDHFVVCHVLLASVHGLSEIDDSEDWHGMSIDILPSGKVQVDKASMNQVVEFWENWKRK